MLLVDLGSEHVRPYLIRDVFYFTCRDTFPISLQTQKFTSCLCRHGYSVPTYSIEGGSFMWKTLRTNRAKCVTPMHLPPWNRNIFLKSGSMHFMKFSGTLVQVHVFCHSNTAIFCMAKQKMPLQRKTIKINDYHTLICWDLGSTHFNSCPKLSGEPYHHWKRFPSFLLCSTIDSLGILNLHAFYYQY